MVFPFDRVHEGTRYRLKDREKARIFQTISRARTITRKQIAALVKSRPTSVSNVVHELIRDRLVFEGTIREPGKPGRPEVYLHPNFNRFVAVSIYVASREIKGALIALDGSIVAGSDAELPAEAGNELVADTIVELVRTLGERKPPTAELLGVGLSLTGNVDIPERRWKYTSRWRNIADIDLRAIENRVGIPVFPNRFINSRLEYLLLTTPELNSGGTLLFHWGYGIGAAYSLDGRVIQPALGSFAEVGHWRIATESPKPCLCGGAGCLETEAALWALSPSLSRRYGTIPEDEIAFEAFFRDHRLESDELIVAARRRVANSLANLFLTLYPDRILFYGPFAATREAFDRVVGEVEKNLPPFARDRLSFRMLEAGYEGDMAGSTHRLFRTALRPLLIAGDEQRVRVGDDDSNR